MKGLIDALGVGDRYKQDCLRRWTRVGDARKAAVLCWRRCLGATLLFLVHGVVVVWRVASYTKNLNFGDAYILLVLCSTRQHRCIRARNWNGKEQISS